MHGKLSHGASALLGSYAVAGTYTTGQIKGVGKRGALKMFTKTPPNIIVSLGQLVSGDVSPEDVIELCDLFYCMLLSSKVIYTTNATMPR